MTPLSGRARRRAARGLAGGSAADLGAIRRSEEIIEMLASRRIPAHALGDPVVALLSCFTADIDAAARPAPRQRGGPRHRAHARSGDARPGGAWPHAAAAAAIATAIAMLTAVAAAVLVVAGWVTRR